MLLRVEIGTTLVITKVIVYFTLSGMKHERVYKE